MQVKGTCIAGSGPRSLLAVALSVFLAMPSAGGTPAIDRALREWHHERSVTAYKYSLVDLNDDGIPDAIVLMTGERCGSGGCNLVILRGVGDGFRVLSSSNISREPVAVLPETSYGWHTISVYVGGGGVGYEPVLMRFNGTRYPLNPTLAPRAKPAQLNGARRLELRD